MRNLIRKIQNTCFQNNLYKKGDKIILAVSGGPDSTCLLDIFTKLQKKYDFGLIIAHINYGLRGKDSDKDEKFVRQLAEKYGLEIFVLRPPAETHCNATLGKGKMPSEETLRKIRYDFFEKIRKEKKIDLIAVAHNADDQVETFLMRVIRGAGLLGLSAMKHKNGRVIRPLLDIPRAEIVSYLESNKLTYRIDKTNLESKFLRNKIRNKLIPYIEKNFNPDIRHTISSSVRSISEDYDYIDAKAGATIAKNWTLSVKKLLALHPAIQKRALLSIIADKKGDLQNIESANITEIIKVLKSTKNKRQTVVFKGLKMTRIGDKITLAAISKSRNKTSV